MNNVDMYRIVTEYYSLAELEERLDMKVADLEHGLLVYIEDHSTEVHEMLMEDLWI